MARNRQRAKQRQAERRARRVEREKADRDGGQRRRDGSQDALADPTVVEPSPAVDPELAVGAPPEDEGRSDRVVAADQAEEEADEVPEAALEEEALREVEEEELIEADGAADEAYAPRGRRGREEPAVAKDRPRFIQFLIAVWAELQRVQWPNRQALITLTGIVLGFVLIAGGYLGLLDAIVSRIIQAVL